MRQIPLFLLAIVRTNVYNIYEGRRPSEGSVSHMAKTANLYARIEPDLKEQAEGILTALGIPASNAITMFYKQIILHKGLPFDVKLPEAAVPDISRLSDAELDAELEKGYADMQAGRTHDAKSVFDGIRRDYGI